MYMYKWIWTVGALSALLSGSPSTASGQTVGPDIIVGRIWGFRVSGVHNGIVGCSFGTESCNVGDADAMWIAGDPNHPVIALNFFRLRDDRFEQIGMSWVKHAFAVVAGDLCRPGGCSKPHLTDRLAPGCSDPYSASLNGNQTLLGPRHDINAASGRFDYPPNPRWPRIPPNERAIGRLLQIHVNDLIPARNSGALYFAEAQYVALDDARAGNGANSVSYRPVRIIGATESAASITFDRGTQTVQERPAVMAWREADPSVEIYPIDVVDDGRLVLAIRRQSVLEPSRVSVTLQNLTSDRGVRSLEFKTAGGNVDPSSVAFHGVPYHSGDGIGGANQSNDAWSVETSPGRVIWATKEFGDDPNANALRWGTAYSFWFETTSPVETVVIGLFKPGTPMQLEIQLPPLPTGRITTESSEVDCGKIQVSDGATRSFLVRASPSKSCKLKEGRSTLEGTHVEWKLRPGEPGMWDVSVVFSPEVALGPFESMVTLVNDSDPPSIVRVRITGVVARD